MDKSDYPGTENQGFTVKEVASFLDETPNVIRNWFKELREYIPHEKNSNGYNIYKREGVDRFKEIKALHRDQNWSMKQIEHYFATGGESFKPEPEKTVGEILADEIKLLRAELSALREENQALRENQEDFNKALIEQLQNFRMETAEQLQQLDRGSVERDKQLMQSLRETLQTNKLLAAAKEEENQNTQKKGFFARLLGK